MNNFLNKLPTWFLIVLLLYLASLISYAVFDNRRVDLWPPRIYGKDTPTIYEKDNRCATLKNILREPANLENVTWLFKRDDGTIISQKVKLIQAIGEGKKINGIESTNESKWDVIDGKLVFFDDKGRLSTEFDKVDCAIVLSGNYLLGEKGDKPVRHMLIGE